jgi:hypothetical protein
MKIDEIKRLCEEYDKLLQKDGFEIEKQQDENGSLTHCRWMIKEILSIEDPCKIERMNRWLGFVQGILWTNGYCDLKIKQEIKEEKNQDPNRGMVYMMYGD